MTTSQKKIAAAHSRRDKGAQVRDSAGSQEVSESAVAHLFVRRNYNARARLFLTRCDADSTRSATQKSLSACAMHYVSI